MTDSESQPPICRWCGFSHDRLCPYVKALEFDARGEVSRVEFVTYADFPAKKQSDEEPVASYQTLEPMGAKR